MKCKNVVPILYSANIITSLDYYTEILGFKNRWHWGNPPGFGGVSKDGVQIFFCEKGQGHPGTWLSILIDNVDEFYTTIQSKGAAIVSAPETMEWGVREMLVEDPDGHKIRFGQPAYVSNGQNAGALPSTIKIIQRTPTAKEHLNLVTAVGWSSNMNNAQEEKLLSATVFAVVAQETVNNEVVGCALLMGDNTSIYYVKDVMVHPAWQHKQIGTAMMQELTNWLDANGAENALVALHTGELLASFYDQFDFTPAFGMNRKIAPKKKRE